MSGSIDIQIRHSTARDLDDVVRIRALSEWSAFADIDQQSPTQSPFWYPDSYRQYLDSPDCSLRVAESTQGIIGLLDFRFEIDEEQATRAHVSLICVDPQHQSRGVGTNLMQYILDSCRAEGCQYALLPVREKNVRAQAFYQRLGWKPDGTTEFVAENLRELTGDIAFMYRIDFNMAPCEFCEIREMELSDCKEVSLLVCASYDWAGRREGLPVDEIERYALTRGAPDTIRSDFIPGRSWVATQSPRIIGVIMTEQNQIGKLYVEPSSTRNGIGRALFRQAERSICQDGHEELILWAVFDLAIPFYREMGMVAKGRKFDLLGKGEGRNPMLMSKPLKTDVGVHPT